MIITGAMILYGPYAPDPTYKNLYLYDTETAETDPNKIPREFFISLRNADGTRVPMFRHVVPFPENATIYPIGETDTGFTVELPTDDGFPAKPVYIIITDSTTESAVYRYAFIEGYQRTGSQKIRCACRFDQWTEHYSDIMAAEFTFSRRHQKRYVDRTASPRTKLYNGLSDPIPEGMVQSRTATDPVLGIYGAKIADTYDATGHYIIPIWLYWRLATKNFYHKATGSGDWGSARALYGVDVPKFAVPILATCVGVIDYNPTTRLSAFRPTWRVYTSTNLVISKCGLMPDNTETEDRALATALDTLHKGHPYIAQSWVSTIPPFPIDITFAVDEDDDHMRQTVRRPQVKIAAARYNNVMIPGDGNDYKIGDVTEDVPAQLTVNPGTFINLPIDTSNPFPSGAITTKTLHSDAQTGAFNYLHEPKIEEAPYEGQTLMIYGAEIDISPTPAAPSLDLKLTCGAHGDIVILSGVNEVYRANGVCSQYGVDHATDSLTSWLLSNYQTYQNAKLWKTINTAVGAGTSIVAGTISGNVGAVLGGGIKAATGYGETITGERARFGDLAASPNSTTLASENAFDNFPFVDLPRIKTKTIPSDIRAAIRNYWRVYGYPDNKIGTIEADATLRESFSYVQGSLVNVLPGVYPGEVSEILGALRSGAWLWKCTVVHEAKNVKAVNEWVYTDRLTPLLSLQNKEVI